MKSENSKLLLGLAIGAVAGAAAGYLIAANKKRLLDEYHHVVEEVKCAAHKAHSKAAEAGAEVAEKTEHVAEKVANKAEQIKDKLEETAAGEK